MTPHRWAGVYIYASLSPQHICSSFPGHCSRSTYSSQHPSQKSNTSLFRRYLFAQQHLCLCSSLLEVSPDILGTTVSMPEEMRYITASGAVPNGGFPAGIVFAAVMSPPPPPNTAHNGPPPAYSPPAQPYHPLPPPGPNVDGSLLLGDHTRIHWLEDGERPCDAPNGYFPHRFGFKAWKVASVMRVVDLLEYLNAPPGDNFGITQMVETGNDTWAANMTVIRGSETANKTLAELGWTQIRSEDPPIWLCMKRP